MLYLSKRSKEKYDRQRYLDDREKRLVRAKQYRIDNKEKTLAYTKEYRIKNKEKSKEYRLKVNHNITMKEYNKMFLKQEGKCALCGGLRSVFQTALCVDHDHETDEIRGLLCMHCNLMLGYAKDNINVLLSAIEYLNKLEYDVTTK